MDVSRLSQGIYVAGCVSFFDDTRTTIKKTMIDTLTFKILGSIDEHLGSIDFNRNVFLKSGKHVKHIGSYRVCRVFSRVDLM